MVAFTPLGDRVLVRRLEAKLVSTGGVLLPEIAAERPAEGIVVAVGDGLPDKPMSLKEGDHVLFGKWAGVEAAALGADHLIVKQDDILGIIKEAA